MVTGEFLDVNEKGCELLGYSREELLPWVLEEEDCRQSVGRD
jgi:PAS domain S-box-containing protein